MQDAEILERVVALLVGGRYDAARSELQSLSRTDPFGRPSANTAAGQKVANSKRPTSPKRSQAAVLVRDGWLCHYCGRRLIASGVIALIGKLCPEEFPFPPGHHMPTDKTHPAAIRVYPNVDHIHAGSLGGDWSDDANLVAACTPCNERKSNRLGWTTLVPERDGWNGLVEYYRCLAESTPPITSTDRAWLRVLNR